MRASFGELDLVTRSGNHLYFVEVKTRRGRGFGGGLEAITRRKQRRMERVAQLWLTRSGQRSLQPHFAAMEIELGPDRAKIHFLPDPFDAQLS